MAGQPRVGAPEGRGGGLRRAACSMVVIVDEPPWPWPQLLAPVVTALLLAVLLGVARVAGG